MTNVGSAQSLLHPLSWARLNTISPSLEHIYWQGNASLLAQQGLAIVGSRRASAQGLVDAKDFAVHAATRGMSVISGLAVGVDAAAHMGGLVRRRPYDCRAGPWARPDLSQATPMAAASNSGVRGAAGE